MPQSEWDANFRNSKYIDQSGFEYDLSGIDVLVEGQKGNVYYGSPSIYELADILFEQKEDSYNSWSNWVEKIQPDYRFATISDKNAEAYLFPNVDDPWMFTEYVFQGKEQDKVVEPTLYDKDTLKPINNPIWQRVNPDGWQKTNDSSSSSTSGDLTVVNDFPTAHDGVKVYRTELNVQCVKWGEHGNIPPHTLNMTAPKEWIEPESGLVTRIVPVVVMKTGSPAYASATGEIAITSAHGDSVIYTPIEYTYYGTVDADGTINPIPAVEGEWNSVWSYLKSGSAEGIKQAKPRSWRVEASRGTGQGMATFVGSDFVNGDIIHEGCQFWKNYFITSGGDVEEGQGTGSDGSSSGTDGNTASVKIARCQLATQLSSTDRVKLKPVPGSCQTTNSACPYYVQKDVPVDIGTFETQSASTSEWAKRWSGIKNYDEEGGTANFVDGNSMLEGGVGAGSLGGGSAFYGAASLGALSALKGRETTMPRQAGEYDLRWEVTFEVQTVPKDGVKVDYANGRSVSSTVADKYLRIQRGTGTLALDSYSTSPYEGVDPIFYGDINQLSFHRWTTSVLHCMNTKYCNSLYGMGMRQGYDPAEMAGGDGACRYYQDWRTYKYGGGCPFNAIPKRAYEYQKKFMTASELLLPLLRTMASTITEDDTIPPEFFNFWYVAGNSWYIGKGPNGPLWYVTHNNSPYPESLNTAEWQIFDKGRGAAPIVTYDADTKTVIVDGADLPEINGQYNLYGSYRGAAVFNKSLISSSSSSTSQSSSSISSMSQSLSSSSSNSQSSSSMSNSSSSQSSSSMSSMSDSSSSMSNSLSSSSTSNSSSSESSSSLAIPDIVGGSIWNKNSKWYIGNCDKSISVYSYSKTGDFFAVNGSIGSPDEIIDGLASTYPTVKILQYDENDEISQIELSGSQITGMNGIYNFIGSYGGNSCYAMSVCSVVTFKNTYVPNFNDINIYNFKGKEDIVYLQNDTDEGERRIYTLLSLVDKSVDFGGINCSQLDEDGNYIVAKFTIKNGDIPDCTDGQEHVWDENGICTICGVSSVPPKLLDEAFVFIDMYDDDGNEIANSPWVVKLEDGYKAATSYTIQVDNDEKFIGGHYPEYKDLTKRKSEELQEVGGGDGLQGDTGVGDPKTWQPRERGALIGYYPDKGGEWIVDGRSLGPIGQNVSEEERLRNIPNNYQGATPIGGIPGQTIIDAATGQRIEPYIRACNIYSSDTDEILQTTEIQNIMNVGLKKCPPRYYRGSVTTDEFGNVIEIVGSGLPTERYGWCDEVHGITLHEKFFDPSVYDHGDEEGSSSSGKPIAYSPWGGILKYKKLTQFPITNAVGKVVVWALPGMVIHGDAYFWKNPTLVNNALIRQMRFKLGLKSSDSGGGYTLESGSNAQNENLVPKLPEGLGYYVPASKDIVPSGILQGWEGITEDEYKKFFSYNKMTDVDPMVDYLIPENDNSNKNLDGSGVDERFITPYSDDAGLKMVTIKHLKQLRNVIQPTLGYLIGSSITGSDFHSKKATYESRKYATMDSTWIKKAGTVSPQVFAACGQNSRSISSFEQFWDGLIPGTCVRKYTPAGVEYWRLFNVIGGYIRKNGISGTHNDSSESLAYQGDELRSSAFFFMHGYIPLDKEIMKAYAIFTPAGEPDFPSVGVVWSGVRKFGHWHPFTTAHETADAHFDYQYGGNFNFASDGVEPVREHHSDEFDVIPTYKRIKPEIIQSKDVELLASPACGNQWHSNINWNSNLNTITRLAIYDDSSNHGRSNPWNYISFDGYGTDIVQNYTEYELWKHYTFDQMNAFINKYSADCEVFIEDELERKSYKFKRMSDILMNHILPMEMQPISGMFDYRGMNTDQRYYYKVAIAAKEYDDTWHHSGQVIVQSYDMSRTSSMAKKTGRIIPRGNDFKFLQDSGTGGTSSSSTPNYGFIQGQHNAGTEVRVLDVTDMVKRLYNSRVDRTYTVQAGLTLLQLWETAIQASAWGGTYGTEPSNSKIDKYMWNYRVTNEDYDGYLLNDAWHYPELVDDNVYVDSFGEKITMTYHPYVLYGLKYQNFIFEDGISNSFKFKIDGNDTINIIIDGSDVGKNFDGEGKLELTAEELATELNTKIAYEGSLEEVNFNCTVLNGKIVLNGDHGAVDSNIKIMDIVNNGYTIVGINVDDTAQSFIDRVRDVTIYDEKYHPMNIISSAYTVDSTNSDNIVVEKSTNASKWFYRTNFGADQYFIMDLMSVPYEKSRQDWRRLRPTYDCSQVICPNNACRINIRNMTVAGWNEFVQSGTIYAPLPSYSATTCSSCGTSFLDKDGNPKLDNSGNPLPVVKKNGDNIWTYKYDTLFDKNPFISHIYVDVLAGDEVLEASKCGFSIQIMNDNENIWETVIDVNYNPSNGMYSWSLNNQDYESLTPPNEIPICDEQNGVIKRARYVRFTSSPVRTYASYTGSEGVKQGNQTYKLNTIENYTEDYLVGAKLEIGTAADNLTEIYTINSSDGDVVYVNRPIDNDYAFWKISYYEYRGGCGKFEVYGKPFREGEMTITGTPVIENYPYNRSNFYLREQPTKIITVYGGDSVNSIVLEETENRNEAIWETIEITIDEETSYKKVIGGKYYYDYINGSIFISPFDQDGTNMFTLNMLVDPEKLSKRTLIGKITVKYIVNAGASVDLSFVADGGGPSYQVEKESICEFDDSIPNNLPDIGQTVKIPDHQGIWKKRDMSWIVYNHDAAYGIFDTSYFTGLELGTDWSYSNWVRLFGESADKIGGIVSGTITIYGLPDTIISGTFKVKAPAKKTRRYVSGDGDDVVTYERTGGLKDTGFILGVNLVNDNEPEDEMYRKTFAWKVPTVIVYARERDITEVIPDE